MRMMILKIMLLVAQLEVFWLMASIRLSAVPLYPQVPYMYRHYILWIILSEKINGPLYIS